MLRCNGWSLQSIFKCKLRSLFSRYNDSKRAKLKEQNVTALPLQVEDTWKTQLLELVLTRLLKRNFKLFRTIKYPCSSKKQGKLKIGENNVALFSRLCIFCQTQESDLKKFSRTKAKRLHTHY